MFTKLRYATVSAASMLLVLGAVPAMAAASSPQALTTNASWQLVANEGEMYGLAAGANGALLSLSYYNSSGTANLYSFPALSLAGALVGTPINPLPGPLTTAGADASQWDAGIATASNGDIYFTVSSNSAIYQYNPLTQVTTDIAPEVVPWSDLTGLVLSPDGQDLYVSDQNTGDVYRLALATGVVTTVFTTVSGGDLQQMAFDSAGDLFVVDQTQNQVEEIPASVLASASGPVTVGGGAQVVASYGSNGASLTGIAFDAGGNLFIGAYSPNGSQPSIGVVTGYDLSLVEASGVPATLTNGEIGDVADSSVSAVDGPQPLAVVGNTLYVGNYDAENIVAVSLSSMNGLTGQLGRLYNAFATRSGTTLTATWNPIAATSYQCVLLNGFNSPTTFHLTTTAATCSFTGLSVFYSFGIAVTAFAGSNRSSTVDVFAPAPGLTCVRGSRTIHVMTINGHCPPKYHPVS